MEPYRYEEMGVGWGRGVITFQLPAIFFRSQGWSFLSPSREANVFRQVNMPILSWWIAVEISYLGQ